MKTEDEILKEAGEITRKKHEKAKNQIQKILDENNLIIDVGMILSTRGIQPVVQIIPKNSS